MAKKSIVKGSRVLIKKYNKTQEYFEVNKKMRSMVGQIYPIKRLYVAFGIKLAIIKNWHWVIDDLEIVKPNILKIKKELFNPNDLVL